MPSIVFGCIADDFTGASDMASFLVKGGLNTEMIDGVPPSDWAPAPETQAIVIALKSRTVPVEEAVAESLHCFQWLRESCHAKQLFFKYCSTFDSTAQGNIGPVIDAVLDAFGFPCTLVSPALPVNGRTVYQGYLFVHDVALGDSSMRHHPLTPMTESNLRTLIEGQGRFRAGLLPHTLIEQGAEAVRHHVEAQRDGQPVAYWVADHFNSAHGAALAEAFVDYPFLSGSSGLAQALAEVHARGLKASQKQAGAGVFRNGGAAVVLAGSCSVATRGQVARFAEQYPSYRIDPARLAGGEETVDMICEWVGRQGGTPCLIYSSDAPESVTRTQAELGATVATLLENTFSRIARRLQRMKVGKIIVAGGETSGAVTQALGQVNYRVGPSVAPGVPVIQPVDHEGLLLVLKSGNFGDPDFFLDAIRMTSAA